MSAKAASRPNRRDFAQRRYLGLDLAGARSAKTALAVLEFYPREKKTFLLDVHTEIGSEGQKSADENVIAMIREAGESRAVLATNVPLTMPPCSPCPRDRCASASTCTLPAVRWMREISKPRDLTPYTQRPIELWVRHKVFPKMDTKLRFDIDEALGGSKAPLTARMVYLARHLKGVRVVEAWPKLTLALLGDELGIDKRVLGGYRQLERGSHARTKILEVLSEKMGIFVYERDLRKVADNLAAFDAFICAFTALLSDTGRCAAIPKSFPKSSGWVEYPAC